MVLRALSPMIFRFKTFRLLAYAIFATPFRGETVVRVRAFKGETVVRVRAWVKTKKKNVVRNYFPS